MTKENAHLFIPLVEALRDGETIEVLNTSNAWVAESKLAFSMEAERYRIKPKPPVTRVMYAAVYETRGDSVYLGTVCKSKQTLEIEVAPSTPIATVTWEEPA